MFLFIDVLFPCHSIFLRLSAFLSTANVAFFLSAPNYPVENRDFNADLLIRWIRAIRVRHYMGGEISMDKNTRPPLIPL